ncbi:MAG: valine--tRNA ligase, partial [Armatimonadetes bacterium]|nr:valine--tRNA ligase [Armatimonadota bacterium]
PGTDHAGIATQNVVERDLAREGLTREDLGRERFLERVWRWKEQYGNIIAEQLKSMGCACDWDRFVFTLDPHYYDAVMEAFIRLHNKGYIYRGTYMVNWCPRCRTGISDLEVDHRETDSTLFYLRYPGQDGGAGIVVATQRPETILADVAVAVHPDDERYRHLIGQAVTLPLVGRRLPIIADRRVQREFGTGAVKVTPGHDPLDYEIGRDHGLETLVALDEHGRMNDLAGRYEGMDRFACRAAIAEDLAQGGFVVRTEPYRTSIGHCDRCGTVLEPYISEQWFCRMKELAAPAIRAVEEGRVRFFPERWQRIFLDWMAEIRDWCISRQLWWGHRIPVWYCPCGEIVASKTSPAACPACGATGLRQDGDVLDTWFSSALWPIATLGWPEETADLAYFYPTAVLATARDIIFLWVARMIMFGLEFRGDVPFRDVYINPTVLNIEGRRMSKSLGTGIDPLAQIARHGADALRFSLLLRCSQAQQDLRFSEKMVEDTRNFSNKIWNAARFVRMNLAGFRPDPTGGWHGHLDLADRWIRSRYARTVRDVTALLDAYEFDKACRALYDFVWSEFCDWYLELAKPALSGPRRAAVQQTLWGVLSGTMALLHPVMPFITEEVWQSLPRDHETPSLMVAQWPGFDPSLVDEEAEEAMGLLMDLVRAGRGIRADMHVPPGRRVDLVLVAPASRHSRLDQIRPAIAHLVRAGRVELRGSDGEKPSQAAAALVGDVEVHIPLAGVIDLGREMARLEAELARVETDLQRVRAKLNDREFVSRAPSEVIEREREREAALERRKQTVYRRKRELTA